MTDFAEVLTSPNAEAARLESRERLGRLLSEIDAALKVGVDPIEFDRLKRIRSAVDESLKMFNP